MTTVDDHSDDPESVGNSTVPASVVPASVDPESVDDVWLFIPFSQSALSSVKIVIIWRHILAISSEFWRKSFTNTPFVNTNYEY